ncbi:MAG: hypothetical protein ACRDS1_01460 [Pseudonocardiaceae bacterium]
MSDDSQATQGGDSADDDQDATGGDDTATDADSKGADGGDVQDDQGDDAPLGPKGEKALAAEKEKRRRETQKRREVEAELAKLRTKDSSDADKVRAEVETEAMGRANARILKAEVRAAAAGRLEDPGDALLHLDLDQFEVDGDGEVDRDEIRSAIDTLLKSKDYLAKKEPGNVKRFQGSADGGTRGKAQPLDQQIIAAEQKGDWSTARRLKLQKMTAGNKQQ